MNLTSRLIEMDEFTMFRLCFLVFFIPHRTQSSSISLSIIVKLSSLSHFETLEILCKRQKSIKKRGEEERDEIWNLTKLISITNLSDNSLFHFSFQVFNELNLFIISISIEHCLPSSLWLLCSKSWAHNFYSQWHKSVCYMRCAWLNSLLFRFHINIILTHAMTYYWICVHSRRNGRNWIQINKYNLYLIEHHQKNWILLIDLSENFFPFSLQLVVVVNIVHFIQGRIKRERVKLILSPLIIVDFTAPENLHTF